MLCLFDQDGIYVRLFNLKCVGRAERLFWENSRDNQNSKSKINKIVQVQKQNHLIVRKVLRYISSELDYLRCIITCYY